MLVFEMALSSVYLAETRFPARFSINRIFMDIRVKVAFRFFIKDEPLAITFYYIGSAEGHEYPDLQVGDEVNPRPVFIFS